MDFRGSGILLHITSLPSPYGIGDLGPGAYKFVDFLADAKQSYWQILPINQTCNLYGNSPYSSYSVFAGNTILISPEQMVRDGYLSRSDIKGHPLFSDAKVDYAAVTEYKNKIFRLAYEKNKNLITEDEDFKEFCYENYIWLDDYILFITITRQIGYSDWGKWPEDLKDHKEKGINRQRKKLQDEMLMEKFLQYLFFKQWHALKDYCESKNIQIIGDIPLYVNYDSADVWANPGIFKLDDQGNPLYVSGLPVDYFSSAGQRWGHPVYDWDMLRETRYSWWVNRIGHNLKLFHILRLDHFRGLVAYWEIPADEMTAKNGRWVETPVKDFFNTLFESFPSLPIIAEDLGDITAEVREIMNMFEFPGMKVLLYAFHGDHETHPYFPHNYPRNCVAYTGTHDNNTIRGSFEKEFSDGEKKKLFKYLGQEISAKEAHIELIKLAMRSVANTVIIPMQDILGLDEKARMNVPGRSKGSWHWRLKPSQLKPSIKKWLSEMTRSYER